MPHDMHAPIPVVYSETNTARKINYMFFMLVSFFKKVSRMKMKGVENSFFALRARDKINPFYC